MSEHEPKTNPEPSEHGEFQTAKDMPSEAQLAESNARLIMYVLGQAVEKTVEAPRIINEALDATSRAKSVGRRLLSLLPFHKKD